MKRHRMPESHVSHPNVTPLIDVVMCMIIFYMLVAKIGVHTGADKRIELPESLRGVRIEDLGNTLTLNVSPAGDLPLVTTLNPATGAVEEVKVRDGGRYPLRSFLQLAKGSNQQFKVIIRADQGLEYRYLEPVLFACAEAQVKEVDFATRIEKAQTVASGS